MSAIREQIGEESYLHLEAEANKEVGLAMQMDLVDQYGTEKYYRMRSLLTPLLKEFEYFQTKALLVSPLDIIRILFMTRLLYAVQNQKEYGQRVGGGMFEDPPFRFRWEERNQPIEVVIETHLQQLERSVIERTLVEEIQDFNMDAKNMGSPSAFFDELFVKLGEPFEAFLDEDALMEKYKKHEPTASEHTREMAMRYFVAPSVSFTAVGSWSYVYFHASAYLRTLLNMLRIAGFLHRGQIDFGMWGVQMKAPSSPFFREPGAMGGGYYWEQDTKGPWEKIPDGCLFLSFGYRGLTKIFLDNRTFAGMEKFFLENKIIFEKLVNPWTPTCVNDIAPTLDILSSATQIQDLGAKILQVYCCLEHLFVPKTVRKDNVKYIIGAINALRPDLIPWFNRLYQLRCDYAHKGFVQRDDKTLALVFESVANTSALLTAKLKQL
jgi:hypothetical protein